MTDAPVPRRSLVSWLAPLAVLVLATAALLWPPHADRRGDGSLLVLLPEPDPRREEALAGLTKFLANQARLDLRLELARDLGAFQQRLAGALVVLCPDAVAMALPAAAWQPLAAGRRRMPWNLRPTAVLVSRRGHEGVEEPWRTAPSRSGVGDSLSLVCLAPLCDEDGQRIHSAGLSWGSDPYDHRAVLAAAEHGRYDHAIVRQWDAEAALAAGRLDPAHWQLRRLSPPVPDVTLLGARRLSAAVRLDLQESLSVLGREDDASSALVAGLGLLGLDGFNLVLGPDFERLRRRFGHCWPHPGD